MVVSYALNGGSPYHLQASGTNWEKLARKLPGQDSRTLFFLVVKLSHFFDLENIDFEAYKHTLQKKNGNKTLPDFEI